MAKDKYAECIEEMIEHCKQTLINKHSEYAVGDDFHNFNATSKLMGITPESALAGMMAKHTVSVYDLIAQVDSNKYPLETWKEKIGDHINYLLILWAMVNCNE